MPQTDANGRLVKNKQVFFIYFIRSFLCVIESLYEPSIKAPTYLYAIVCKISNSFYSKAVWKKVDVINKINRKNQSTQTALSKLYEKTQYFVHNFFVTNLIKFVFVHQQKDGQR